MSTETHLSKEIEKVLVTGDLARLTPEERLDYYKAVCESIGLNPLTNPFDYIMLNGKLRLYAKKDATDQLRRIYDISVEDLKHDFRKDLDLYIVTASGHGKEGRSDVSTGAVSIGGLRAEALANAIMKAETKAKRRLTLSLCGLGVLDETEIETLSDNSIPATALPAVPEVPKVNQTPAAGTEAPRPGESGHEVLPQGRIETPVDPKIAAALAAVPGLKTAAELSTPQPVAPSAEPAKQPAKRVRKPKENSPVNGRDVSAEGGITDADIASAGPQVAPGITPEAAKQEAEAFVADLDPTPTKDEMAGFSARTRELAKLGAQLPDLKNYILADAKKADTKQLTVGNWEQALDKLEQAQKDGKLLEVTKNVPLPTF